MIVVIAIAVLIAAATIAAQRDRPEPPDNVTHIAAPRPLRNPRERR